MSAHKNMQESYAHRKRSKEHDHKLIERYQTLRALIATHEGVRDRDIIYIKDLYRRRDQVRTQMKYAGII